MKSDRRVFGRKRTLCNENDHTRSTSVAEELCAISRSLMPSEPRTPEEYIHRNYLRDSDRRVAARIGWTRARVKAYREAKGLARSDEEVALRDDDTSLAENRILEFPPSSSRV